MQTVADILRRPAPELTTAHDLLPHVGGIGLEIEVEGLRSWPDVAGWRQEQDGSLRDGREYVFDGPAGGAEAVERIGAIVRAFHGRRINPSFRCSTHIHMDVRDLRLDELDRLVLAYMTLEDVMFDHCAPHRRWSNFCIPMFTNSNFSRSYSSLFREAEGGHSKVHRLGNWAKYSALNLKPVTEYGSVEFRGSHCMTTEAELIGLAQRMLHLKRLAKEVQANGTEFVERLSLTPLAELFPTGLTELYVRGEEAAEDCYVNAMSAAGTQWRYRQTTEEESYFDPFRSALRSAAPSPRRDATVRVHSEFLQQYHLQVPGTMALSEVLRVIDALRSVRGMQGPTLSEVLADPEMFVGNLTLSRCAEMLGLRLTSEFLGSAWSQPTYQDDEDEDED